MFRYNSNGEFNVPYGGIAYNSKDLDKKIKYYRSNDLQKLFAKTSLYCLDFEDFLERNRKINIGEMGFMKNIKECIVNNNFRIFGKNKE